MVIKLIDQFKNLKMFSCISIFFFFNFCMPYCINNSSKLYVTFVLQKNNMRILFFLFYSSYCCSGVSQRVINIITHIISAFKVKYILHSVQNLKKLYYIFYSYTNIIVYIECIMPFKTVCTQGINR